MLLISYSVYKVAATRSQPLPANVVSRKSYAMKLLNYSKKDLEDITAVLALTMSQTDFFDFMLGLFQLKSRLHSHSTPVGLAALHYLHKEQNGT